MDKQVYGIAQRPEWEGPGKKGNTGRNALDLSRPRSDLLCFSRIVVIRLKLKIAGTPWSFRSTLSMPFLSKG